MKYTKPCIIAVLSTADSIRSVMQKQPSLLMDHINGSARNTGPAYEVDE